MNIFMSNAQAFQQLEFLLKLAELPMQVDLCMVCFGQWHSSLAVMTSCKSKAM